MYVPTSRLISTCIFWPRRGSLSARPSTSKYIHKYTYMHMTHASLHTRYTVVHLGLYLHAYVCLVLPHYQPNPISASKYIYRYAYVRTQIYMQHILTYILAHIYVHTLASSTLIVRPSFSMHANVYILTCALYVSTSLYLHLWPNLHEYFCLVFGSSSDHSMHTRIYIFTYDIYIIYISGYFDFLSCFIVSRPSSSMRIYITIFILHTHMHIDIQHIHACISAHICIPSVGPSASMYTYIYRFTHVFIFAYNIYVSTSRLIFAFSL